MMTKTVMLFMNKTYPAYEYDFQHCWNISDFKDVFKMAHKQAIMVMNKTIT